MTRDEKVRAAVSAVILALIDKGLTVDQAYDKVFGEGAYRRLSDEVWEANQKAGA